MTSDKRLVKCLDCGYTWRSSSDSPRCTNSDCRSYDAVLIEETLPENTKIALISSTAKKTPPNNYGGLELIVHLLGKELVNKGLDVTLIAPQGSELEGGEVIETVPRQRGVKSMRREGQAFQMYKQVLPTFDLICDHSWSKHSYLAKAQNPELMEDTHVCGVFHGMPGGINEAPPVEHPNFIGVSDPASQEWSEHLGVSFRTAHNSIKIKDYPLKEKKENWFLSLNRIMPEKGIHEFVSLMDRLEKKAKVAGEDQFVDNRQYVNRVMDMCDQRRIEYLGRVREKEKVDLLQRAKALLLFPLEPYKEVFGMSAAEANACGTPVIALNNCGLKDVIENGKNGFLVNSPDKAGEIIESGKLESVDPADCREVVENNFTPQIMGDRYLFLFSEILNNKQW